MPPRTRPSLTPLEDRWTPAAGDLDPTFGTGGKAVLTFPEGQFRPTGAAVSPDGRLVVAGAVGNLNVSGGTTDTAAVRLNPDGTPDPTFGHNGLAVVPPYPDQKTIDSATAVVVLPDGRIVLGGGTGQNLNGPVGEAFAVTRLLPDGRRDPAFGTNGTAVVSFAPSFVQGGDRLNALVVQPDGRIVAVGKSSAGGQFAAARLNPDGTPDQTFGSGGTVLVSFPNAGGYSAGANAVALQPDGRIVLAGSVSGPSVNGVPTNYQDFAAARLLPDGRLDPGFGDGGRVTVPFDLSVVSNDGASAVAVQPDGRIVLAGYATQAGAMAGPSNDDFAAVRLLADGRLDPTFGTAGKVVVPFDLGGPYADDAADIVLQPDGRVVLAGSAYTGNGGIDFAAARLLPGGGLDPAFGTAGKARVAFDLGGTKADFATAAALTPGQLVLVGSVAQASGADLGVARLVTDLPPPVLPGAVLVGGSPDGTARRAVPGGDPAGAAVQFFPGFTGAARTALADVTGDGVPDLVAGAGPGGGPNVVVRDGATGRVVADLNPFEGSFTGGVFVTAADMNGDGRAEVVVTPDRGGPAVVIYDGAGLAAGRGESAQLTRFFGIEDPDFRGGARAAVGDLNGDGTPDLAVAAGFGGGPRVAVFDGRTLFDVRVTGQLPPKLLPDFFVFEPGLRNGVFVAAGDLTGDGAAELIVGGGPGGGPRVQAFSGADLAAGGRLTLVANFFAGDPDARGGVRVAVRPGADGQPRLVTGSGDGEPARVRVYSVAAARTGGSPDQELAPFGGAVLADGLSVG